MFRFQTQTARDVSGVGIRGGLRRSPLRVNRVDSPHRWLLPLFPQLQTSRIGTTTSEKCQFRKCSSLDRAQSKQRVPTKSDHLAQTSRKSEGGRMSSSISRGWRTISRKSSSLISWTQNCLPPSFSALSAFWLRSRVTSAAPVGCWRRSSANSRAGPETRVR